MKDAAHPSAADILSALGYPLRRKVLRRFQRGSSSPVDLSRELKVQLSTISYHVRVLNEKGLLELVAQVPARGSIKHFYSSKVVENERVVSLLAATEKDDEKRSSRSASHA